MWLIIHPFVFEGFLPIVMLAPWLPSPPLRRLNAAVKRLQELMSAIMQDMQNNPDEEVISFLLFILISFTWPCATKKLRAYVHIYTQHTHTHTRTHHTIHTHHVRTYTQANNNSATPILARR